MRRIELLSKQSPTRQRLQLFPSSYPKVSDGIKNSFGLAIVDSRHTCAQKNRYTTSFTHDITVNGLWSTTLGGNYLWLVYLQLNSCHARHTKLKHPLNKGVDCLWWSRGGSSRTRRLPL